MQGLSSPDQSLCHQCSIFPVFLGVFLPGRAQPYGSLSFPACAGVIPTAKRAQIVIDSIFLVCTRVIRPFDDGFELKFYFPAYAGVILHDLLITKLSSQFSRLWEVIPVQRS